MGDLQATDVAEDASQSWGRGGSTPVGMATAFNRLMVTSHPQRRPASVAGRRQAEGEASPQSAVHRRQGPPVIHKSTHLTNQVIGQMEEQHGMNCKRQEQPMRTILVDAGQEGAGKWCVCTWAARTTEADDSALPVAERGS